jgi:hypothetical protein
MFISAPENFERNVKHAGRFRAGKARIDAPDGTFHQGIVIWSGKAIRAVMPTTEALRLANEIADAIGSHKKEN